MNTHLAKGSRCPPANKDKIRLYSNKFCPYSERIHLILDAKEILYDVVYININCAPEWYLNKCVTGKVPSIEMPSGEIVFGSTIIAQYLDDKYPNKRLISKDNAVKYKDLMLIEYFNDVIASLNAIFHSLGRHSLNNEENIKRGLDVFEKELEQRGAFFGGKQPGVVDFFLWPWVERADLIKLFRTRVDLRKENFKNIMQWHSNMLETQAVKKNMMDIDTHTKFLQTFCSGVPVYDL